MKHGPYQWTISMVLIVGVCLAGCSDEEDDVADADVTGNWDLTVNNNLTGTLSLTQSVASVSGTFNAATGGTAPVSGNISGDSVTLTFTIPDLGGSTLVDLRGTRSDDNTIVGSWTDPDTDEKGTWRATRQQTTAQ